MTNLTANGIECLSCGYVGITSSAYLEVCPLDSGDRISDHWAVAVQISACDKGMTPADWLAGDTSKCDSPQHEFKSGNHVAQVEG